MKVLTISDLLNLTKAEIFEIRRTLTIQLGELPQGSIELQEAVETLANIEIVMARPEFKFRHAIYMITPP